MILADLRCEVQQLLRDTPASRPAVLRRSRNPDYLLACDIPGIASHPAVEELMQRLRRLGWQTFLQDGWLLLDKAVPSPSLLPMPVVDGEMGCCLSLLRAHPGDKIDPLLLRRILLAGEAGRTAL